MSLSTTVGFWGISTWVPPLVGGIAAASGLELEQWASYAGMAYTFGSILGYVRFGGYGQAAMALALIYVVGIAATPFLAETVGKPLPV